MDEYIPDSDTIVLSSCAMYWTGVPAGGVDLNWTRDLTTSVNGAQVTIKKSKYVVNEPKG